MLKNDWIVPDPTHTKSQKTHLSNAEVLIHRIPVIKVHTNVVRCIGSAELGAGHPLEYIQVNTKYGGPSSCKYCGLRYELEHEDHSHDNTHHSDGKAHH